MAPRLIRNAEVIRPGTTPLTSSVLDHATVKEVEHFGLRNNEGLWPSYNCIDTLVPSPLCPDPTEDPNTFTSAEWMPAFEFANHGAVKCSAVGLDVADMKSEVKRVFALNEGKGVERALRENRFIASPAGSKGQWDAPVDLSPTAVPLTVALALLEGYGAQHYAGVLTIHMPRTVASLLGDRIEWRGGKAYTRLGSKVAIGGGYDGQTGTAGEWEMFATGEVYVERSSTIEVDAFVLPGDGSGVASGGVLADNDQVALVARMYRVAIDCFAARVVGSVALTTGGGGGTGLVDNGDGTWSTP